jgi:hypothetical protein
MAEGGDQIVTVAGGGQDIAGGAGLFSSILGPLSMGVQLFGTGMQIAQAMKARRAQRSHERAAEDKLAAAKRQLSTNRLEGLQIPMTAFQQAAGVDLAMQQQALAGLAESDPRALAAGIGKVQAVGTQGTETRRQAMEKTLFDWEKMVAENQQKIDQLKGSISLQEVAGAQAAAKEAKEQFGQAATGAVSSLGEAIQTGYELSKLYSEDGDRPFKDINAPKFRDTRLKNDYTVGQGLPGAQQLFNQPAYGGYGQSRFTLDSIPGAQASVSPFSIGGMSGFGFQSLAPNNQGL